MQVNEKYEYKWYLDNKLVTLITTILLDQQLNF